MMDPITKDEVKVAIVQYVSLKGVVRLVDLVSWCLRWVPGDFPPVQTMLAELLMEHQLVEKMFRRALEPVQFLYFAADTYEAHMLQEEMAKRVQYRPKDFDQLTSEQRWNWDKALGILDYRGE